MKVRNLSQGPGTPTPEKKGGTPASQVSGGTPGT